MDSSPSTYDATADVVMPANQQSNGGGRTASQQGSAMAIRILCIYGIFDGADVALLPASFRALEASFGFSPTRLGVLAVVQGVSIAASGPFWGALADAGFSRRKLLAVGAGMWSCLLICLAFTTDFRTMIALRGLNGVAMGMLTPVMQSLVFEKSKPEERGQNFGMIEFFRLSVGMMGVMVFVTGMSNQIIFGMPGFRLAFLIIALGGLILAPLILWFMEEEQKQWRPEHLSVSSEILKLVGYLKIPTFRIIVIQGCFGSIAEAARQFLPMYFQYIGMTDSKSGLLAGVGLFCWGMGSVLGGVVGDRWTKVSLLHGRALTAQATVLSSILSYYIMFEVIPRNASMSKHFLFLTIVQGLMCSWAKTGCNKPIFLEIVPKHSIGSAMAWEMCIEKTAGQFFGPMAVGLLSDMAFGYKENHEQVSSMAPELQMTNVIALGNSLCLSTVLPSVISLFVYGFLHLTYQHDIMDAKTLEKQAALVLKKAEATEATCLT